MKSTFERKTIYINAQFLTKPAIGFQRFGYQLINAFDELLVLGEIDSRKYCLELITPHLERTFMNFQYIPIRQVGKKVGIIWENIELPRITQGDLLFNPCNTGPLFKRNQIVFLYGNSEFGIPGSYFGSNRMAHNAALTSLARSARVILADSQFSKEEIIKHCHISKGKVHSVPSGCDHISQVKPNYSVFAKYGIGKKPYLLAMGGSLPQENLSIVLKAVASISRRDFDVVIVGKGVKSIFPTLTATDEELKALFLEANVAVFPSTHAGSGIAPLEAMTCGCPVICSRLPVYMEVCKNAVLYFDPANAQDLADAISRMTNTPPLQRRLRWEGRSQAEEFTWISTARKTWNIIRQVADSQN